MRDSAFDPVEIPADFWSRPDVTRALARRDIGALFRLLQQRTGIEPEPDRHRHRASPRAASATSSTTSTSPGRSAVMARIADGLNMPGPARAALGLAARPVTSPSSPGTPAPGAPRPPGPAAQYPATAEQAVTAVTSLWQADEARSPEALSAPLDPAAWNAAALAWLVSQPDSHLPASSQGRAVGRADVARVRAPAELFAELDNRFGGAHARRSLIHFLDRDAAALLAGRYTDDVGRELFAAIAEASLLAAWTSYDCGLHGLAQRYFVQALRLAQSAADRRLACSVLSAMSHQATYLGHLPEAANLARAAHSGLRDTRHARADGPVPRHGSPRPGPRRGRPRLPRRPCRRRARVPAPRGGPRPGIHQLLQRGRASRRDRPLLPRPRRRPPGRRITPPRHRPSDGQYARSDFFVTHRPGRRARRPGRPRTGLPRSRSTRCASARP